MYPVAFPGHVTMKNHAKYVISKLPEIARKLTTQITPDLVGLTELLDKCQNQPGIDSTVGSFASIVYRLCEAFKVTATLGYIAKKDISGDAEHQLATVQVILENIGTGIENLINGNLVFLSCDVDTLRGHPEVEKAAGVTDTLVLIRSQILDIEERLYYLGEEAKALLNHQSTQTPAQNPESDDPSWKLMKGMLSECLAKAQQSRKKERHVSEPMTHPKPGKQGMPYVIYKPSQPSSQNTWHDLKATAVFVPNGKSPLELNGVAITPWKDQPISDSEWNSLDLFIPADDEPPFPKSQLPLATGVVTVEPDGRFWLVSPTNGYGGYETTFAKGKLDGSKITPQSNAIKEAAEESGLKVKITGYLGDFKRTTSMTRLYLAERVGGDPCDMGWESQAVRLVPLADLPQFLQAQTDKQVLEAILTKFKS